MYLAHTSQSHYNRLCWLDVYRLEDRTDGYQEVAYEDIKQQLQLQRAQNSEKYMMHQAHWPKIIHD